MKPTKFVRLKIDILAEFPKEVDDLGALPIRHDAVLDGALAKIAEAGGRIAAGDGRMDIGLAYPRGRAKRR